MAPTAPRPMPAGPARRKTHSKSKNGCYLCKKRHTKCDEEHPRCGNCTRLDARCEWPQPRPSARRTTPQSANLEPREVTRESSYTGSPYIESPLPTPAAGARTVFTLEDMQLLHHWTTRVVLFHDPTNDDDRWIWSEGVVSIALEHTFLLHGLLALSALHKTVVDSVDRAGLLAQADAHMSAALATYLRLLEEAALETVVPCFVMSSLCLAYNLATAQVEEPEDPLGAILHCFRLLRGVKVVIGQYWQQLQQNHIIHKLVSPVRSLDGVALPEDTKCLPLLALRPLAEQLGSPQKEICLEAIDDLHKIFVRTTICSTAQQENSVIMTWPAMIQTEFIDLCHTGHHVGALIVVYWAVLLVRHKPAWWLDGWLPRLIRACEELFVEAPELKTWLEWPIEISSQSSEPPALCSTQPSPMVQTPVEEATSMELSPADVADVFAAPYG